jgi:hypothetical protein
MSVTEPTTFHASQPKGDKPPKPDLSDWLYLGLGYKPTYHYNNEMTHSYIAKLTRDESDLHIMYNNDNGNNNNDNAYIVI